MLFYHKILKQDEVVMKQFSIYSLIRMTVFIQCIFLVSGCNKIIDWGKQNFQQAAKHSQDLVEQVQPFFKTTIAYNQFATVAEFNVLFLTDQVRLLYVDYHKRYHGLTPEQESLMIQRVLNENKYFVSFYVVGSQPDNFYESNKSLFTGEYQKLGALLGDKDATWHMRLKIGNKQYLPESVKVAELPVEYRHFFGDRYSQFKSVYLVRFDARDAFGYPLFSSRTLHTFSLQFLSSFCKTEVEWQRCLYSKSN